MELGVGEWNEGNDGNAGIGVRWRESGRESSYGSGNDEQKMSRGMKIEQNVCSNENIVLTLWYEKQLKKLI